MNRNDGRTRAVRYLLAVTAGVAAVAGPGIPALAAEQGDVVAAGSADAIAGRYIVVLEPGPALTSPTADTLARRYGGRVHRTYDTAVRGFSAGLSATAARRLAADPAVDYVEQDRRVSLAGTQGAPTWGLDRIDQRSTALSGTYTSASAAGVTAYVLDTGVRTSHAEFGGRATDGWDFIDNDAVAQDCHGHGTHVAGTIGGATYGVAKDVRLVAVRVLDCEGNGSYSQIIDAVDWVAARAGVPSVANLSLGGPADQGLDDAVTRAVAAGISFAVAAGNNDLPACTASPARAATALTVGATDATDTRATFSNYGSCVDLFAPGIRIVSAGHTSDTGAAVMSGTSMATPHVAGAAALVLGRHPAHAPAQVREALVAHATAGAVIGAGAGSPNLSLFTGWLNEAPAPDAPAPEAPAPGAPAPEAPVTETPARTACRPFTNDTDVAIADLRTVRSSRWVSDCTGPASARTFVDVTIDHRNPAELALSLFSPDGRRYPLTDGVPVAGGADRYVVDASASPRAGQWTLLIRDTAWGNTGVLDTWTVRL